MLFVYLFLIHLTETAVLVFVLYMIKVGWTGTLI